MNMTTCGLLTLTRTVAVECQAEAQLEWVPESMGREEVEITKD